jgi:hypothetical protein
MSSTNAKQIVEAADLLNEALRKVVVSEQGTHAETLIAAAARMAGTMLFHSFSPGFDHLPPGTVCLTDQANTQGPELLQLMLATLGQLGHTNIDRRALAGTGERCTLSSLSLAETQQMLEPWYRKIQGLCGLSLREVADAGAIATAMLIHDCGSVLPVATGCAIAVDGMVESAKTVPQRVAEAS